MAYSAIRCVELNNVNHGLMRCVRNTLTIFRDAVSFISDVAYENWDSFKDLSSMKQCALMESLIHTTKYNDAAYKEFDEKFYKFPSYYRRSAINCAIGGISSYISQLAAYEEKRYAYISNGKRFKEKRPVLNLTRTVFPSMYKKEMYLLNGNELKIKLFIRNTWDWVSVSIPNRDRKCLLKAIAQGGEYGSPSMLIKNRKVYLHFPFEFPYAEFPTLPVKQQKILGVDLGVNRGAVCSVVDASGTIHERIFDPFISERDQMNHMLNRLRIVSRESGTGQKLSAFYTKLDGIKNNYVHHLAHWIVAQAVRTGVYGISMEYLGRMKTRGRKKDRIHHWCKRRILELVRGMAMRYGIRVFQVNPKNTSALAFDGSGYVTRDEDNFSLCTFTTGKRYDCDLGASYNIAARYFIRAYFKSMPATAWSQCVAEVPALVRRTGCTLSTLWQLDRVICQLKNAA